MSKIVLGRGPGGDVSLDLAALIKTKLLIQANSGGGKSWAIRRILEQSHGLVQHIVIDPEGEFASLREKFDYVLAAPSGGDTTAEPRYAKLLAHRLLELGASAIIDIYELAPYDRIKFVRLFADALVNAPKSLWHPCIIVLDEAHNFCPQTGEAESARPLMGLASKGRKRGFALIAATQRIAKLHKDLAAECNNKLIGRSALDVDMKRAAEELGFSGREQQQELRRLPPGDFLTFGPAIGYEVTRLHVGPVKTSHPEVGSAFVAPAPTAKIKALLPKLADLPAEAEQEARDVASLQRDLAETRRKLTLAQKEQRVEQKPCEHAADMAIMAQTIDKQRELVDRMRIVAADVLSGVRSQLPLLESLAETAMPSKLTVARPQVVRPVKPPSIRPPSANGHAPTGDLDGPERRILNAIAWLEAIGVEDPEQPAVAFLAGYTYGGGAFNNPRGRLRGKGLVKYVSGDRIRLTEDGQAVAEAPDVPIDNERLHEAVLARLEGPQQRLLRPLLAAYPDALSNEELAEAAGYTPNAGAFNNPRGRLRSLGLIDYPQPGRVVARPLLFPEGQ